VRTSEQTKASGRVEREPRDQSGYIDQTLEIEIEISEGRKEWILAWILIEDVVKFWRNFMYSPLAAGARSARKDRSWQLTIPIDLAVDANPRSLNEVHRRR
jgi:hypothetical protein